jgi:hypothetical protein
MASDRLFAADARYSHPCGWPSVRKLLNQQRRVGGSMNPVSMVKSWWQDMSVETRERGVKLSSWVELSVMFLTIIGIAVGLWRNQTPPFLFFICSLVVLVALFYFESALLNHLRAGKSEEHFRAKRSW